MGEQSVVLVVQRTLEFTLGHWARGEYSQLFLRYAFSRRALVRGRCTVLLRSFILENCQSEKLAMQRDRVMAELVAGFVTLDSRP